MEQVKAVYVSDKDVSELIGVARQTLANWRHQQKGPRYVKGGRLVRYAMSDVLAFMEVRKVCTEDQPKEQG
jgi:predicted DNA-binding transcriptional regulator AlpA